MRRAEMFVLVIWSLTILSRGSGMVGGGGGDYPTFTACKAGGDKAAAACKKREAKALVQKAAWDKTHPDAKMAFEYGFNVKYSCTPDNGQPAIYGPDDSHAATLPK
jgi:hypothetical protein